MRKKLLLTILATTAIAVGSVGFALNNQSDTKSTSKNDQKIVSSQTTTADNTQSPQQLDASTTQDSVSAVPQQTQPIAPTPEENKVKIMGIITDYATIHLGAKGANQLAGQLNSFDAYFNSNFGGYGNYDTLYNSEVMQAYLSGQEMWVSFMKLGPQSNVNIYGY